MNLNNGVLQIKTSEIGARISSLRKGEKNFIFPQQTIKKKDKDKTRGGIHLCSPIFGKKNGEFDVIPQHGGIRDAVWKIKNPPYSCSVQYECELRFKRHKYWLVYNVCYRLLHNCLQVIVIVNNKLNTPVPFELGWHPYFFAPEGADIFLTSSKNQFIHVDQSYGPKIFSDIKTIGIKLHGIGAINFVLGKRFVSKQVCIWTDSNQYVCVEPLLSHPDDFNTKKGFFLEPDNPFVTDLAMCFR